MIGTFPALIFLAVGAVVFIAAYWSGAERIERLVGNYPWRLLAGFVALFTLPHWFLGSASLISDGDEGTQGLPLLIYKSHAMAGHFAHGVAGGTDLTAMFPQAADAGALSVGAVLIALLPIWYAVLLHKLLVAVIATTGAYALARQFTPRPIWAALPAILYVYGFNWLPTLWGGAGYAFLPWAILLTATTDAPGPRIAKAALLGFACSLFGSWMHVLPGILLGLATYQLVLRPTGFGRWVMTVGAFAAAHLANDWPAIHALALNAHFSGRALLGATDGNGVAEMAATIFAFQWDSMVVAMLAGVLSLAVTRPAFALRMAAGAVLPRLLLVGLYALPWPLLHLDEVRSLHFNYFTVSTIAMLIPTVAVALNELSMRFDKRHARLLLATMLAVFIGGFASVRAVGTLNMLRFGGLRQVSEIANLKERPWQAPGLYRVLTVGFGMAPNIALAYGLEAWDSDVSLVSRDYTLAWLYGFDRTDQLFLHQAGEYSAPRIDHWAATPYDFDRQANVALLQTANVRYVISRFPLRGESLRQVSGPPEGSFTPLLSLPAGRRLVTLFHELRHPTDAYVYELANALPRAYFAAALVPPPAGADPRALYDAVAASGPRRQVVGAVALAAVIAPAIVGDIAETADGYRVQVAAPLGGLLVLNASPWPFWRAEIDGKPAAITTVNGFQLAVPVPAGAQAVEFHFHPQPVPRL